MHVMEIYKASAGSGKTFRLTLNYLKLALQHPEAFRSIQAVTFTNKATAEMKHRILEVLRGLATGEKDADKYRQVLLTEMPGMDESQLTSRAAATYSAILHDYSRFNISTIDAFVQRIIRSFSWELGIDSGFRLQLAIDPVKDALTERLYRLLDTDKHLLQWIATLAQNRLEDGKNWNPRESLQQLSGIIFTERFEELEQALSTMSEEDITAAFDNLRSKVYATLQTIEKRRAEKAAQVLQMIAQAGVEDGDLFQNGKGSLSMLRDAVKKKVVPLNSYAHKLIQGQSNLAKAKLSPASAQRVADVQDELLDTLRLFDQWNENDIPSHATATLIKENLGELKLVRILAQELSAYRSEENLLLMGDIHALLRRLTEDSDVSFLYEKTGQQLRHFLMDEFQDTSTFQWANFRPLILESLAADQYNMLVGDVKQAIYRWRNGDWRLLHQQVEASLLGHKPAIQSLTDNYRSTGQVIEFNNLLFYLAPQWLQTKLNDMLQDAGGYEQNLLAQGYGSLLTLAYQDSFQVAPKAARQNGLVCINWIDTNEANENEEESSSTNSYDEAVLSHLTDQIASLLQEGFLPGDLAIITRTNAEATKVVSYLIDAQRTGTIQYQVVSGEALKLASNAAVQLLLAVMQWLNDPRDTLAITEASYLYRMLKGEDDPAAAFTKNNLLPPSLHPPSTSLLGLPAQELVHRLIGMLGLDQLPGQGAFLLAFSDLVSKSMAYGESSLPAFLQYWEDEGKHAALPASYHANAVEVLTVHKSKGLAYRVVLMPYLDVDLKPKNPLLLTSTSGTGYEALPMLPIKWKKDMAKSHFAEAYYEELALTLMDNLNVLYVAFTRARDRIYGWSPAYKNDAESITAGNMLFQIAKGNSPLPDAGYLDTRTGYDPDAKQWIWGTAVPPAEQLPIPPKHAEPLMFTHWPERVHIRYQALQTSYDHADQMPRKQGLLWHDILHRMQHPDDLTRALAAMQQAGLLSERDMNKAASTIGQMLKLPLLEPWHNRTHRRLSERAIADVGGILRRPDMVLYNPAETIVYDFKFTENRKDQPAHEAQVLQYMHLLHRMQFPGIRGVLVYALEKITVPVPFS